MNMKQAFCIVICLLTVHALPAKFLNTLPNLICSPGMKYCSSEIIKGSNDTSYIYTCNKKGNDLTASLCSEDGHLVCVTYAEEIGESAECKPECQPDRLYCGSELADFGGSVSAKSLYRCESSTEVTLVETCSGFCLSDSKQPRCMQVCEPSLNYCGHELNTLEDWDTNYLPNGLYRCDNFKSALLIEECTSCESSAQDSYCSSKTFSNACEFFESHSRVKRVQGGTVVESHKWPWMASLRADGVHWCGGALISSEWILTAAHCFPNRDPNEIQIVLGNKISNEYRKGERRVKPNKILTHENYNPKTYENDFALLHLENPVNFSHHIRPLCLSESPIIKPGDVCYVAGWGNSHDSLRPPLMEGKVSIMTAEECRTNGDRIAELLGQETMFRKIKKSAFICAGRPDHSYSDTCPGDSGGPLMCQNDKGVWFGAGVTSWGAGCTESTEVFRFPGFYTKVDAGLSWIVNITGIEPAKN